MEKKALDMKTKDWIVYHQKQEGITSVLRVLAKNKVAVARAYCSAYDSVNHAKGRSIALNRMKSFLPLYLEDTKKYRQYRSVYRGDENVGENYVLFEVVNPENLLPEEKSFWNSVIAPRLKKTK